MAAVGAQAAWLTADHPLQHGAGPGSPLEKLVQSGGKVLLLGSPLANVSVIHHAEHLADIPDKRTVHYRVPVLQEGQRVWVEVEELDSNNGIATYDEADEFGAIVRGYLQTGRARTGKAGAAESYLFDAPDLGRVRGEVDGGALPERGTMKHAIWVVAMLLCGTVAYGEGGPVEKSPETGLLQFARQPLCAASREARHYHATALPSGVRVRVCHSTGGVRTGTQRARSQATAHRHRRLAYGRGRQRIRRWWDRHRLLHPPTRDQVRRPARSLSLAGLPRAGGAIPDAGRAAHRRPAGPRGRRSRLRCAGCATRPGRMSRGGRAPAPWATGWRATALPPATTATRSRWASWRRRSTITSGRRRCSGSTRASIRSRSTIG